MILTWIFGGIAVLSVLFAIHTRRDLNEARQVCMERSEELANALGEVNKLSAQNMNKQETISNLICACKYGQDNLRIEIWECPDEYPLYHSSYVSVVGAYKEDQGWYFTLKEFNFDKNDPSDREFAIRQAEELIEIIQNF